MMKKHDGSGSLTDQVFAQPRGDAERGVQPPEMWKKLATASGVHDGTPCLGREDLLKVNTLLKTEVSEEVHRQVRSVWTVQCRTSVQQPK